MDLRTVVPSPDSRRRTRYRTPRALAAAALLSLGALLPHPVAAEDGFCPANLEQSDPCGGADAGARPDSGSARPPSLPAVTLANPISLVTGAKRQRETDFALDGAPLAFQRHYDSAGSDIDVGLGLGWRHSLSVALFFAADGGLEIVESSGRRVRFDPASEESGGPAGDAADEPSGTLDATSGNAADIAGDVTTTGTAPAGTPSRADRVVYPARLPSDGFVRTYGGGFVWHLPDGRTLRFQGSFLVRIDWPAAAFSAGGAARSLALYYHNVASRASPTRSGACFVSSTRRAAPPRSATSKVPAPRRSPDTCPPSSSPTGAASPTATTPAATSPRRVSRTALPGFTTTRTRSGRTT